MAASRPELIANRIVVDYIDGKKMGAGDRLPTVTELQKKYDTSLNTVVSALGILERQQIIVKRRGQGSFVCERQDSEKRTVANTISFVGTSISAELTARLYAGAERICASSGYQLMLVGTNNDYDTERQRVGSLIESGCSATILYPCTRTSKQLREDYLANEFLDHPIVLVDIAYPQQRRPCVIFDNYKAGFDMTKALIAEGHTNIAFMTVESNGEEYMHYSTRERYRGYVAALESAGFDAPMEVWRLSETPQNLLSRGTAPLLGAVENDLYQKLLPLIVQWRCKKDRPSALIALEDRTAVTVATIAREMGIDIPKELRVVGFDNLECGAFFYPPFPTTCPDFERAGEIAAEMVIQLLYELPSNRQIRSYMLPAPVDWRQVPEEKQRMLEKAREHILTTCRS